jgi:hypothetical protein
MNNYTYIEEYNTKIIMSNNTFIAGLIHSITTLCHDLCNLLFVIIGIFYEEMQNIFIRKYSIFTGLSGLKVTGYDIKPGIAN